MPALPFVRSDRSTVEIAVEIAVDLAIDLSVDLAVAIHTRLRFADLALRHTRALRQLYFIGANETAATLSGIAVARVRTTAYVASGLFAALAGALLASRLMAGTPTAGNALELQVLAAAVIGGASLSGGRGTILVTLAGALLMQTIASGCTQLEIRNPVQDIILGVIIVAAVTVDQIRQRRA